MLFGARDVLSSVAWLAFITSCSAGGFRSTGAVKTTESPSAAAGQSGASTDQAGTDGSGSTHSKETAQGAADATGGSPRIATLGDGQEGSGSSQSVTAGSGTGGGSGAGMDSIKVGGGSGGGGSPGGNSQLPVVTAGPPAPPAPPAPTAEPSPEQMLESACNTRPRVSDSVDVVFPENTGARCAFGRDGNNSKKNGALAARIERTFAVGIPRSRIVCSMTTSSDGSQIVLYDDHLFLALNDNLIMTRSAAFGSLEQQGNGFRRYDWNRLKGLGTGPLDNPFCAEGVSCQLPQTERTGTFGFSLSESANKRLFGSLLGQDLTFKLVITGDDNPESDCQLYRSIRMKISYTYVNN